jgi:hypothetical protein
VFLCTPKSFREGLLEELIPRLEANQLGYTLVQYCRRCKHLRAVFVPQAEEEQARKVLLKMLGPFRIGEA